MAGENGLEAVEMLMTIGYSDAWMALGIAVTVNDHIQDTVGGAFQPGSGVDAMSDCVTACRWASEMGQETAHEIVKIHNGKYDVMQGEPEDHNEADRRNYIRGIICGRTPKKMSECIACCLTSKFSVPYRGKVYDLPPNARRSVLRPSSTQHPNVSVRRSTPPDPVEGSV